MAISIAMDLSDAKERSGYTDMEPGIYAGKTTAVEAHKDSSIKFVVDCGEAGDAEMYLGLDLTKQGNRNSWFAMLASHGKNMEKIKEAKGAFSFTEGMVLGKPCFVMVSKVEGQDAQGRPKLNDKSFISKERYEALKAAGGKTPTKAATPAANGAAPAAGASAPAGTPPANLFD
jgi:hypothetical protein